MGTNTLNRILGKAETVEDAAKRMITSTPAPVNMPAQAPVQEQQTPAGAAQEAAVKTSQRQLKDNGSIDLAPKGVPAPTKDVTQDSYFDKFMQAMAPGAMTQQQIDAEKAEAERRRRWAAINDGISAMSNLYFATQGAPSSYNPENSATSKTREYWDKLIKDHEAQLQQHTNDKIKAKQMDLQNMRDLRDFQASMMKQQSDREMAQRKLAQDQAQFEKTFDLKRSEAALKGEQTKKQLELREKDLNLKAQKFADSLSGKYTPFQFGDESFNVESRYFKDPVIVAQLFNTLPKEKRETVHGRARTNNLGETEYDAPTVAQMAAAVGVYADQSPKTQGALMALAGEKSSVAKDADAKMETSKPVHRDKLQGSGAPISLLPLSSTKTGEQGKKSNPMADAKKPNPMI